MHSALVCLFAILCLATVNGTKVFMGYYAVWSPAQTWQDGCGLKAVDIPATKYTHIIAFSFTTFSNSTGAVTLFKDEYSDAATVIPQLFNLTTNNPNLKYLLCIGSGAVPVADWKAVMSSASSRANFISTGIALAQQYSFAGIEIDWEGLDSETAALIETFFREFRAAAPAGFLITASIPVSNYWLNMYMPQNVVSYVDYFNAMMYDYTGYSWSPSTYANTPLYGTAGININDTISWYTTRGMPTSKIVFGFANFARSFTMSNPGINKPPPFSAGTQGNCDKQGGYLTQREVEKLIATPPSADFKVVYDEPTQTPYITYADQYISYDNTQSVAAKLEVLHARNLAGGMIYPTDYSHALADQIWASLYPSTSSSSSSTTLSPTSTTVASISSSSSSSPQTTSSASITSSKSSSTTGSPSASTTTPPDQIKNSASSVVYSLAVILVACVCFLF